MNISCNLPINNHLYLPVNNYYLHPPMNNYVHPPVNNHLHLPALSLVPVGPAVIVRSTVLVGKLGSCAETPVIQVIIVQTRTHTTQSKQPSLISPTWEVQRKIYHNCEKIVAVFDSTPSRSSWLDDQLINAAQSLIKKQYPLIGGLQPLALSSQFAMIPPDLDFVQVVNVSNNHWLALSTVGCRQSTIKDFDSLQSGGLPKHNEAGC